MSAPALDRLRELPGFKSAGKNQWAACCPGHKDDKASLAISIGNDDRVLLHCFAGCDLTRILEAARIEQKDLFATNGHEPQEWRIVATYDYLTVDKELSYQVVRYEPKDFRQRKPDGNGGWIWKTGDLKRLPYHLPELAGAEYVFVLEGEKDVDALRGRGLAATCNSGGAGKWTAELSQYFRADQHITIIPDNDEPGRKHAQQVAASLFGKVASVKILELPGLPDKGDVSDWLKGRDPEAAAEELSRLAEAAPEWKPPAPEDMDPWKPHIFTLRDALQPLPPAKPVIAGLIERPSVNAVYSPPGCHKTNYCVDLAVCTAAGIRHLDALPNVQSFVRSFKTTACPVMVLDFDNGRRRLHERVGAFARGHGVREDAPIVCVSMPSPWLVASDQASMDALAERVTRYKIGLLIVDNLLVTSGAANENDPEMAPIMAAWRRLSEWCDLATILIHHPNKRENVTRAGDRLRGHGSIEAALDLALFVEREETSGNITVKATKVRGSDVLPYGALFTYEHAPGSTELLSARFYGVEVDDSGSDRAIRETILQVVTESPRLNKSVLKEQVHKLLPDAGLNRIGSQIELLDSKRQIKHEEGQRGARLYVIASKQNSFTDSRSFTEGL